MKTITRIGTYIFAGLLVLTLTGCATVRTLSKADPESAKIFSGTRLDIRALSGEGTLTKKFNVLPPAYPAIDLPFSMMLDVMMLPLTTSAALYEYVFE